MSSCILVLVGEELHTEFIQEFATWTGILRVSSKKCVRLDFGAVDTQFAEGTDYPPGNCGTSVVRDEGGEEMLYMVFCLYLAFIGSLLSVRCAVRMAGAHLVIIECLARRRRARSSGGRPFSKHFSNSAVGAESKSRIHAWASWRWHINPSSLFRVALVRGSHHFFQVWAALHRAATSVMGALRKFRDVAERVEVSPARRVGRQTEAVVKTDLFASHEVIKGSGK